MRNFSIVLNGEITSTKTSAENLFSLPICVIMETIKLWRSKYVA